MYDYIVIGAGIVSSFITWRLTKNKFNVLVVEKNKYIASGTTSANSGIIHSGHDPIEGTLKAKLCVRGNELFKTYKDKFNFSLRETGAFLIAKTNEEAIILNKIKKRAENNGVKKVVLLDKTQAKIEVPNLDDNVISVLNLPTTAVINPIEVTNILFNESIKNNAVIMTNQEVVDILKEDSYYKVITKEKVFKTRGIINSAGLYSEDIVSLVEREKLFTTTPVKGEYYELDNSVSKFINKVIYPIPGKRGKGVLITPQTDGKILIGPNAIPVKDKEDTSITKEGLSFIKEQANYQLKDIPFHANIRNFAGIRSTIDYGDFYIKESKANLNVFHLGGIDSPGLTAAPAIAEYLLDLINKKN